MIQITEPATLVTDYVMAALAFVWHFNLRRFDGTQAMAGWRMAFLWLALASFLGGSYHGYQLLLPAPLPEILWRATLITAALASLYLLKAGAHSFIGSSRFTWTLLAYLKAAVFIVLGQVLLEFTMVLADFLISLAVVSALAI